MSKNIITRLNIKRGDLLIGVDAGAQNILKLRLIPDVVLGDFDSLNKNLINKLNKKHIPLIEYPRNKDSTDSQITLEYAIKQKVQRIVFVGLSGNRLDHILTNLFFITNPKYKKLNICFMNNKQTVYLIKKN